MQELLKLADYRAAPSLDLEDWSAVLQLVGAQDHELMLRLLNAMAEDQASPDVPVEAFGLLLLAP